LTGCKSSQFEGIAHAKTRVFSIAGRFVAEKNHRFEVHS
jgi:hypothetical protein